MQVLSALAHNVDWTVAGLREKHKRLQRRDAASVLAASVSAMTALDTSVKASWRSACQRTLTIIKSVKSGPAQVITTSSPAASNRPRAETDAAVGPVIDAQIAELEVELRRCSAQAGDSVCVCVCVFVYVCVSVCVCLCV